MSRRLSQEEFIRKANEKNEHIRNGEIEIRGEYTTKNQGVECFCNKHNVMWYPTPSNIYHGGGCYLCKGEKISKVKSTTKDEFIELLNNKCNTTVLYGEYYGMDKNTEFLCSVGHIFLDKPSTVLYGGVRCPYCSGKKVLIGFNDLWTTHPDIAKLLKNPEDGYKYTYGSKKNLDFICPYCGNITHPKIYNVCRQGLSCPLCSDGVSYPEKFIRQLLTQMQISFIPQISKSISGFEWVKNYRYDCYFEYCNCCYFIETDGGLGHGNQVFGSNKKDTDGLMRDREKDALAIMHNIDVIRIDCNYSMNLRYEHMKNAVINSKLNKIFDLSIVDWDTCNIKSQNSLVKEACDLYIDGITVPINIGKVLNISETTAREYLKRGAEFGWCDYNARIASQINYQTRSKSVIAIDINNNKQYYFDSISACSRELTNIYNIPMFKSRIAMSCKTGKSYKGFLFQLNRKTTQN